MPFSLFEHGTNHFVEKVVSLHVGSLLDVASELDVFGEYSQLTTLITKRQLTHMFCTSLSITLIEDFLV